jgi:hypothetical protein
MFVVFTPFSPHLNPLPQGERKFKKNQKGHPPFEGRD